MSALKIAHLNIGKSQTRHSLLAKELIHLGIDLICLQEPYTIKNTPMNILGYDKYHTSVTTSRIKSVIYARTEKQINLFLINDLTDQNIVTVHINFGDIKTALSSIYVQPNEEGNRQIALIEHRLLNNSSLEVLLLGDFNARSPDWYDTSSNHHGQALESIIAEFDLHVINQPGETFTRVTNGKISCSTIDLTIASASISQMISEWSIEDSSIFTEHKLVSFNVALSSQPPRAVRSTRRWRITPQSLLNFTSRLGDLLRENLSFELRHGAEMVQKDQIDNVIEQLEQLMEQAAEESFSQLQLKTRKLVWWNGEIETKSRKLRSSKSKLSKIRKNNKIPPNALITEHDKLKEEVSKLVKEAKIRSFKKTVADADPRDVWAINNKIVKLRPPHMVPATLKINGTFMTDEVENARGILDHFYQDPPPNFGIQATRSIITHLGAHLGSDLENDPAFTLAELEERASSFSARKAPGTDGFTADICKAVCLSQSSLILNIFNSCLAHGYFPRKWKNSLCKIIPKPDKPNYEEIESWRPLGLLPVMGKILESLIIKRLSFNLHTRLKLSHRQFGFTEQTSTVDLLQQLVSKIKRYKLSQQVAAVSLDIRGAFDNAKWPIILQRLIDYKVPANIVQLLASYLEDRLVSYLTSTGHVSKPTSQGCVQGSIAGPTLWNVLLNEIFSLEMPEGVEMFAFADDITVLARNTDPKMLASNLSECLNIVNNWGIRNGLTFGPSKTQFISFTKHFKSQQIYMARKFINRTPTMKILGVVIDENLKFTSHLTQVLAKASRVYLNMTRIAKVTWGAEPEILREIFLRAIEPMVTYACTIWSNALEYRESIRKLEQFQRKFVNKIAKAYRTVTLEASQAIANIIPLDLKIKELVNIQQVKTTKLCPLVDEQMEYQKPIRFTELAHPAERISIQFSRIHSQEELNEKLPNTSECTTYYTDGSLINGKTGAAWLLSRVEPRSESDILASELIKLNRNCSVFQCELTALKFALIDCLNRNEELVASSEYNFCSDSLSSLMAIADRNNKNPIVHYIHETLTKIHSIGISTNFYWVEAHGTILGNEMCDLLAKQAANSDQQELDGCRFPLSCAKRMLRRQTIETWNQRYINSSKTIKIRNFIPDVYFALQRWKYIRPSYYTTQFLTGHGAFREYLHRFGLRDSPSCQCGRPQSNIHILNECPIFESDRILLHDLVRTGRNFMQREESTNNFMISTAKKLIQLNNVC